MKVIVHYFFIKRNKCIRRLQIFLQNFSEDRILDMKKPAIERPFLLTFSAKLRRKYVKITYSNLDSHIIIALISNQTMQQTLFRLDSSRLISE
ncbi:hypothetical protein ACOMICROBIO_LKFPLAJE_05174 (plasmid) [Vibrio sp. B1FIG11]|nr:hypothetical protein ACOMICROBIO_LKFPLAJE_05174 [Vibrio sp. B1FIG11]